MTGHAAPQRRLRPLPAYRLAMAQFHVRPALRLAEAGVAPRDIMPGVIRTGMTAPVAAARSERMEAGLSPIHRWGEPEYVGRAVALLASGTFPLSTGDAFHIDGGLHIPRV